MSAAELITRHDRAITAAFALPPALPLVLPTSRTRPPTDLEIVVDLILELYRNMDREGRRMMERNATRLFPLTDRGPDMSARSARGAGPQPVPAVQEDPMNARSPEHDNTTPDPLQASRRDVWDGKDVWVPVAPEPFYRPPSLRSLLWAGLARRPKPSWRATAADPNPNERRWRRG